MMIHSRCFSSVCNALLALLLLVSRMQTAAADGFGIPGTTQTEAGYDTEMGEDPICWSSVASATPEGGIAFPNGALVKDFALADKVQLLSSCPGGTWLEAHAPPEFSQPDFRPRTLHWYNYTVKGSVDLSELAGTHIAADEGSKIAIAILACDSLTAGFCSPFVHEQANIRLAREKEAKMAAGIPIPPAGPKIPGNPHGGTHIHSPAVVLDVPIVPHTAPGYELRAVSFDFDVQVPLIVNVPGNFFLVGTLQFFTGDSPFSPVHRYDVANALKASERLVVYQEPATILEVAKPIRIISYVAIGLASAVLLGLIFQVIKYRTRQVLRLSQAPFLLIFLLAGLVATVSCFLLQPHSDLWCNLSHPLIIISLHLFYSITLARLWRINAVVSPLLKNRLQRAGTKGRARFGLFSRVRSWFCASDGNNSMRQEISPAISLCIVFACCLPQILLQIAAWLLQPQSLVLECNESQSIGRNVCSDNLDHKESLRNYALYLLLLLVLVLLYMGHVTRNLPSLLNESQEIYDTTMLSVLLTLLGGGVVAVTNAPTTSPDVGYLVKTFVVLSITVNSALRIIVPKLRMVWADQQIVVSKLVSDQRQSLTSSYNTSYFQSSYPPISEVDSSSRAHSSLPGESKISLAEGASHCDMMEHSSNTEKTEESPPPPEMALSSSLGSNKSSQDVWLKQVNDKQDPETPLPPPRPTPPQQGDVVQLKKNEDDQVLDYKEEVLPLKDNKIITGVKRKSSSSGAPSSRRVNFSAAAKSRSNSHLMRGSMMKKKMVIRQGEAPNRKIVLRMVDLQQELEHVTKQVMCGLNVEPQDWLAVRKLTQQLEQVFHSTQFDFEQQQQNHDDNRDEEMGGKRSSHASQS